MDAASFPVAAKDMANLRGNDVGVPYLPTLPTPEGPAKQGFIKAMPRRVCCKKEMHYESDVA